MFHVKHTVQIPKMARLHAVVYGTVQGVGFRYFIAERARALDVSGYVLNRADGAVEVEASGDAHALDELRRTLENGPSLARVERVEELTVSVEELRRPFEVRRG